MNFYDRALPMAKLGVPVFPLRVADKTPAWGMNAWQTLATTDLDQLKKWNDQDAAWNAGLVAYAQPGGTLFLEFDVKGGMKAAAEEMGQPLPVTRVHGSGGGFGHWIFRHTERSIALGNRQAKLPEGGEWFSLRADRRYVVAPGSIHPNGNLYTVRKDIEPAPIPDWVCDWVEKHSEAKPTEKTGRAMPEVCESFDFDDFCEHYSDILGDVTDCGDNYHVPEICPGTYTGEGTGHHHEHSVRTGFFYDGESLGFHCFAGGCEAADMGIGAIIRHMNQFVEPYPHQIWQEEATLDWADDVALEQVEQLAAAETEVAAEPAAAVEPATSEEDVSPFAAEDLLNAGRCVYPGLAFPYEALPEGLLKRLTDNACEGGVAPGLVVPALLTLASCIPMKDVMDGMRCNLYTCLLALVGAGKDTAIRRSLAVLGLDDEQGVMWTAYSPSGEKNVATLLGDKPPKKGDTERRPGFKKHCIISYEFEETMAKSRGESSAVLQMMQHLYDHNTKIFCDSKTGGQQKVSCRTSWLTALPVGDGEVDEDAFRRVFSESATHGMLSRFVFGFTETRFDGRKSRNWKPLPVNWVTHGIQETDYIGTIPEELYSSLVAQLRCFEVKGWASPELQAEYESWVPEKDFSGRDTYHIGKLATLTALLNQHELIQPEDWRFALAFQEWQGRIREFFTPGRAAENSPYARAADRILRTIERKTKEQIKRGQPAEDCYFRWRRLSHDHKWPLMGLSVEKCVDLLVKGGMLAYALKSETEEDKRKVRLAIYRG